MMLLTFEDATRARDERDRLRKCRHLGASEAADLAELEAALDDHAAAADAYYAACERGQCDLAEAMAQAEMDAPHEEWAGFAEVLGAFWR